MQGLGCFYVVLTINTAEQSLFFQRFEEYHYVCASYAVLPPPAKQPLLVNLVMNQSTDLCGAATFARRNKRRGEVGTSAKFK